MYYEKKDYYYHFSTTAVYHRAYRWEESRMVWR